MNEPTANMCEVYEDEHDRILYMLGNEEEKVKLVVAIALVKQIQQTWIGGRESGHQPIQTKKGI